MRKRALSLFFWSSCSHGEKKKIRGEDMNRIIMTHYGDQRRALAILLKEKYIQIEDVGDLEHDSTVVQLEQFGC